MLGVFGDYDYDYGATESSSEIQVVLGKAFQYFDLGVGFEYISGSYDDDGFTNEYQQYGPMLYAATGMPFGEGPLGWYAGGSFVPKLFGDYEEFSEPFLTLEGGIYGSWEQWMATLGYRVIGLVDDIGGGNQGIASSVAFKF